MARKGVLNKFSFITISIVVAVSVTFLLLILTINPNLSLYKMNEARDRGGIVSEKWDFNDLDSYSNAANYYFGNTDDGYLQGHASVLSKISEESIKDPNDKLIYRLTTNVSWRGPDFMLRIEYKRDMSEGEIYSKCVHWEDKGSLSRHAIIKEKSRHINKKEIEAFEEALAQDRFWEINASSYGDDGVDILFEGNDGNQYRVQNYFDGNGIERIHKTLFDMEKQWIIKEFSHDERVTKDLVKSVKKKFWPLYGHITFMD